MTMTDIRPEDEVVRICQELIRIDTSNYGDGSGPGERAAAEYTAGLIAEVGLDAEIFESAPGRASVVTRLAGEDPSASALVVHGHLDVVPALREQWSVDPFGARTQGRPDLGPRRRGHEGHGRHDPVRAAELRPHRAASPSGT